MSDEISSADSPAPVTPGDQRMYEQEYKHGAHLFQKALDQYVKSDNPYQQEEFRQVMQQAMRVLNETANELHRAPLLTQNKQIEDDFNQFIDQPKDTNAVDKLHRDLDQAKKSIG